jgi:hypothetical protein
MYMKPVTTKQITKPLKYFSSPVPKAECTLFPKEWNITLNSHRVSELVHHLILLTEHNVSKQICFHPQVKKVNQQIRLVLACGPN